MPRSPSPRLFYHDLNMSIVVKEGAVCNEVKKSGLLIDKGLDLEVSPGDTVTVYVSMGGFEK